jgi:catechol 2,3-dioxygenase-like lactoylglutathione lyase family enzyme
VDSTKDSSVDFKFEVVVIPVSDVDRAKSFYGGLGWRLDADYASDDGSAAERRRNRCRTSSRSG